VRELDAQGKSVKDFTGLVLELELVGVLIKLENLEHLGDDIEVRGGL